MPLEQMQAAQNGNLNPQAEQGADNYLTVLRMVRDWSLRLKLDLIQDLAEQLRGDTFQPEVGVIEEKPCPAGH